MAPTTGIIAALGITGGYVVVNYTSATPFPSADGAWLIQSDGIHCAVQIDGKAQEAHDASAHDAIYDNTQSPPISSVPAASSSSRRN